MEVGRRYYRSNIVKLWKSIAIREEIRDEKILGFKKKIEDAIRLREERVSFRVIQETIGISRVTFYRYMRRLRILGSWRAIEKRSTRPKSFRMSKIPQELKDAVLDIRLKNRTWGKEKINTLLKHPVSDSTIGRIIKELKMEGKIPTKNPAVRWKRKIQRHDRYGKRWDYKKHLHIKVPGTLIQIDHMVISMHNRHYFQFSAIDKTTRFLVSKIYASASSGTAARFLKEEVLTRMPFKIESIQTDGGSEFMKYFESACKENNLELFVLPLGVLSLMDM